MANRSGDKRSKVHGDAEWKSRSGVQGSARWSTRVSFSLHFRVLRDHICTKVNCVRFMKGSYSTVWYCLLARFRVEGWGPPGVEEARRTMQDAEHGDADWKRRSGYIYIYIYIYRHGAPCRMPSTATLAGRAGEPCQQSTGSRRLRASREHGDADWESRCTLRGGGVVTLRWRQRQLWGYNPV